MCCFFEAIGEAGERQRGSVEMRRSMRIDFERMKRAEGWSGGE
jgi:hypothetical protein